MNLSAWIVMVTILLIIFYMGYEKYREDKKTNDNLGIIFEKQFVDYIGGFQEISGGDVKVNIKISNENLYIYFINKDNNEKIISMSKIIDAECSTSEQVSKDLTLGRIVVFGILAWGLKKKTKEITKCAIITYKDENNKLRSLVFETHPDELVRHILDIKKLNQ
jgi:hypothetical protein